ncbi:MAG: hypothetical protein LLG14_21645 [Nocardiaceae bacterium]|nr:hypothetical protein [Nocardiaceae bacterium]
MVARPRRTTSSKTTSSEDSHTRTRRELLARPGHWAVLRTSVRLNEAAARRLARNYTHAKPARLDPDATGHYAARPFQQADGSWHVAVTYQPTTTDYSGEPVGKPGRAAD